MARESTSTPAVTSTDVTHLLATAKPSSCGEVHAALVTHYGEAVADLYAASGCKRLPRHSVTAEKGHVAEKPNGLLTLKQRAARKAALAAKPKASRVAPKMASRVITVGGAKLRVFADGRTHLVSDEVKVVTQSPETAKPSKVQQVAEVVTERVVAAPAKATHTSRPKADPTATGAIRRASRRPKAEPVAVTA